MTKATLKINQYGTLAWRNEKKQCHREDDKPAVIYPDGRKEWWIDGKLHRDNGNPAVIWPDGYKQWWMNGNCIKSGYVNVILHRDNNNLQLFMQMALNNDG